MKHSPQAPLLGCTLAAGIGYVQLVAAVNLAMLPVLGGFNGLERIVGRTERTAVMRVADKGSYLTANGGQLGYVTLVSEKGDTVRAMDRFDLFEGKYLPNSIADELKVGEQYTATIASSFAGENLLDAKPIQPRK